MNYKTRVCLSTETRIGAHGSDIVYFLASSVNSRKLPLLFLNSFFYNSNFFTHLFIKKKNKKTKTKGNKNKKTSTSLQAVKYKQLLSYGG